MTDLLDLECYGGPLDGDFVPIDQMPKEARHGRYSKQRIVLARMQRSSVDGSKFLRVPFKQVVWFWYPREDDDGA